MPRILDSFMNREEPNRKSQGGNNRESYLPRFNPSPIFFASAERDVA